MQPCHRNFCMYFLQLGLTLNKLDGIMEPKKITFEAYQPGYRPDFNREGKSGQHRATHRSTAGSPFAEKRKGHRKLPSFMSY